MAEYRYVKNDKGTRYYIANPLNQGGFGIVYSGKTSTGTNIAIKIIKPSPDHQRQWQLWLNEVEINIKCLYHRNIVQIIDFFKTKGRHLVIIMEKAEGSLRDLIAAGYKFSIDEIYVIALQILEALHHIHNKNVIHRDVTPKNILIFPKSVYKLADFGIAKEHITSAELIRTLLGYRSYVPPEILWYGYASQQSDIYQLGLVLLTLLIGEDPIPSSLPPKEIYDLINKGKPRQIAESLTYLGGETGELADIISIMLRRRDEYRYQSVAEVRKDLANAFTNP